MHMLVHIIRLVCMQLQFLDGYDYYKRIIKDALKEVSHLITVGELSLNTKSKKVL